MNLNKTNLVVWSMVIASGVGTGYAMVAGTRLLLNRNRCPVAMPVPTPSPVIKVVYRTKWRTKVVTRTVNHVLIRERIQPVKCARDPMEARIDARLRLRESLRR